MNNNEIQTELRIRKQNKNVKLSSLIDFRLSNKVLTLTLTRPCENMQSNEAAFEGWAIVLKSAFGSDIDKVILDIVATTTIPQNNSHYHRLLWRIHNFSTMFDWFEMGNCRNDVNEFMTNTFEEPIMNVPSRDRGEVLNSVGERLVEYHFVNQNKPYYAQLKKLIDTDLILNQIPVGLFRKSIKNANRIFTGGSSAIDLLGFKGEETLHLIELKIGDNIKLGVISEFLFYAFIMRGLFVTGDIRYPESDLPETFDQYYKLLKKKTIKEIDGHLLCEKYHPLLDDAALMLLNDGLKPFKMSLDRLQYHYDPTTQIISDLHKL